MGDTLIYIPLLIIGLTGLLKRKIIGIYAMFGALAITVYWPIVALSTLFFARGSEGFTFDKHLSYSIILSFIVIYGLWGMWYLFTYKESIVEKHK